MAQSSGSGRKGGGSGAGSGGSKGSGHGKAGPKKTLGRKPRRDEGAKPAEPKNGAAAAGGARRTAPPNAGPGKPLPDTSRATTDREDLMGSWQEELDELSDKASKKLDELVDKARPAAEKAREQVKRMAVDLSGGAEGAFAKIRDQARDLAAKGQHTRVRIKFRDRQIAELPIAVVAAAEAASLWWFGPLRLLLGHVVGKAVLDVEFVSNADHHVAEGRKHLSEGESDKAMAEFEKALSMDRRHAGAYLGKGIALKLRGDKAGARTAFEKAVEYDARSEAGREAQRHLDNL